MSPRNFIRRFKAATRRLPGAYVQSLRISGANEMLERSSMPVQNISSEIGYEDLGFFRNVFKRHTGMTRAEYRARFGSLSVVRSELSGGAEERA